MAVEVVIDGHWEKWTVEPKIFGRRESIQLMIHRKDAQDTTRSLNSYPEIYWLRDAAL